MNGNLFPEGSIYDQLAKMHSGPRVIHNVESGGVVKYAGSWLLTRAEDIRMVLQRPDIFSNHKMAAFSALFGETWDLIPLEKDPPEHGRFRMVMNGTFAPGKIEQLRSGMRDRARHLIGEFVADGECEFVESFGRPFPVSIFIQLMGLPQSDTQKLNAWEHGLLHAKDPKERADGARGFGGYIRDLIALRRREPVDDVTTFFLSANIDGRPITDEEVLGMCFMLLAAGLDTVAASLGLYFHHLALFPEDQARLRANSSLIPSAVEEFLRCYAIVTTNRWVKQDVEVGGVQLKVGDRVICSTQLACLDPAEFENPTTFDMERSPNRHVAFSYGPHRCLGSHLARMELNVAMEEFLGRVPAFRLADDAKVEIEAGSICSIPKLKLVWS